MTDDSSFEPPEITNDDMCWVSRLLGLPVDAFSGQDGADPRQDVFKSMGCIDVAACPGSGKTTLLVAKLAILAEKWRYRTRGICVLSHTNVARQEIETRLGSSTTGRRLLSYPHFIGTIHGFVNDFLASPWLRSLGYPIKMIDTDNCLKRRWYALPFNIRSGLERNRHGPSVLSIKSTDFSVGTLCWAKSCLGADSPTYCNIKEVCCKSTTEGYFCYDEMFVWANDMLTKVPGVIEVIRNRFPILFIDEVQDNSEDQSVILHRIFMDGNTHLIRQRFGDGNQAIFDSVNTKDATTDKFPASMIKKELPNSHRFGQTIADLSDPLGLIPYNMKGHGPKKVLTSGYSAGRHTIFLFDDDHANKVIDAYAELLVETFSEQELHEGTFTAIGHIHKPPEKPDEHKFPHHIGHYWPAYDPVLASRDPKPQSFIQYLFVGTGMAQATGEAYLCVEKIAEGILRLAGMNANGRTLLRRRYNHRYVLELLMEYKGIRRDYENLVYRFAVKKTALTRKKWDNCWVVIVREIAEAIAGVSLSSQEVDNYLTWKEAPSCATPNQISQKSRDNIYRYPNEDTKVCIRTGSIHSVKGETHTATLVLETFWQDSKGRHNLELLIPWLCGDHPKKPPGVQQQSRLKLHYVAMTRPTHLLCLAMKRSIIGNNNGDQGQDLMEKLRNRGWDFKTI
jgi:hypothetical protein